MGYFWSRIKPLRSFWSQLSRSYHHHQNSAPFIANHSFNSQIRVRDRVYSAVIGNTHFDFPLNIRFFAAPVQLKPKQEEKDPSGPRLNEKIQADIVRLVSDEGHDVVSRMEALQRAAALNLDLVEVDRNAKPPVCKIMDYHMEKYKQHVKDKDRAKSKTEVTLRKGDCKEVRFSVKIEQKDLEMKANTVKRLMERGYRVKCMATGTEKDDLGGLVDRLSTLIEDISIVESGPRVEKKQAYIVVRHTKFGPSKKGAPKKSSKTVDATNPDTIDSESSSLIEDDENADQSGLGTDDEAPLEENNRYKRDGNSLSMDNGYKRPESTPVLENRYKRPENTPVENRYRRPENTPVVENRYNRANNSLPNENRYNRENNGPPMNENRYNRENNAPPMNENRYNRVNNSAPSDNRYNRENNAPPVTDNRYNRANNSTPNENRYNRVNNSTPGDNRYNRENNSPSTENRYRRDNQYNANAEGGRVNDRDFRGQPQPQAENRYRNGNNFEQTRHPRAQGGPPTPHYSDNR